jgi:ligand-binding sensor domain-containing protein
VSEPPKFFALLATADGAVVGGSFARGLTRSADGHRWEPVVGGPASVNALAVAVGGRILAGTGAGVAVSTDGGASWDGAGLEGETVYAIESNGRSVVAGTQAHGAFVCTIGRWDWWPVEGLEGRTVFRLLRRAGDEVWAGTADDGVWWIDGRAGAVRGGLEGRTIHGLTSDDHGRLVAGTNGDGVHWCDDGRTWRPLNVGLPDPVVHTVVSDDHAGLLAGTGAGVARWDEGAAAWSVLGRAISDRRIFSLAVGPDGRVFAGSYDGVWSLDLGTDRWARLDTGLAIADAYAVDASPSGAVHAGTADGVRRSDDGGRTWTAANAGLENLTGYCFYQRADGAVLTGTDDGMFGRTGLGPWERSGLEGEWVFALTDARAGVILAGTRGHGVHRSCDGGRSWLPANDGLRHPLVNHLFRTSWDEVFVAGGEVVGGHKTGGMARSDDTGVTWTSIAIEPVAVYRLAEDAMGTLYAAAQRCRLFVSTDRGRHWDMSDTTGLVDTKCYSLAAIGDGRLVLGTAGGLLRSVDQGRHWTSIGHGLPEPTAFDLAVAASGRVLAATPAGVWRSPDGGTTWTC